MILGTIFFQCLNFYNRYHWMMVNQYIFPLMGLNLRCTLFYPCYCLSEPQSFKPITPTKFSGIFALKQPTTQFRLWIVLWYIKKEISYILFVNLLTLLQLFLLFFAKNTDYHFYILKDLTNLVGIFMWTIKWNGSRKKSPISIKYS